MTYVKLSADRKLLDDSTAEGKAKAEVVYGPRITKFYNNEDKDFPHYSTVKLIWDKEEFLAMAELGCRTVVHKYAENLLTPSGEACIAIDRVTTTGTGGKK